MAFREFIPNPNMKAASIERRRMAASSEEYKRWLDVVPVEGGNAWWQGSTQPQLRAFVVGVRKGWDIKRQVPIPVSGADRQIVGFPNEPKVEVRVFKSILALNPMLAVCPLNQVPGMPCEAWWEANGQYMDLMIGCRKSVAVGEALPLADKGDGLDGETRESLVTTATMEGVKFGKDAGDGEIIERIRKHRESKAKKETVK